MYVLYPGMLLRGDHLCVPDLGRTVHGWVDMHYYRVFILTGIKASASSCTLHSPLRPRVTHILNGPQAILRSSWLGRGLVEYPRVCTVLKILRVGYFTVE